MEFLPAARTSIIAASLATLFCSDLSFAREKKWTHYGVRPLAMGNAYVAVADDFNALFYNPAGLARIKEWDGEIINPYFEISTNTIKSGQDVTGLASAGADDTNAVLDLLEDNTGMNHHFALGLTPHFIMQGFGFGIGLEISGDLAFHREISAEVDFGPRVIVPFTFATNFLEDRLSLGASVKYVAKAGVDHEFSIQDLEAFSKDKNKEDAGGSTDDGPKLDDFVEGGTGIGTDVGLLFTPIKTMEPTLGISITDLGGTPYKKTDVNGEALAAPDTRLPSVNTGISLKPWQTDSMYVRTSIDAHSINQPIHYSKKFNLGLEWGLGSILKVQSGLHQGELTGGFEFDVFLLTLRFATYTEQLGTYAGQDESLRDRRYILQIKLLI
jgi:hypothetical protein